MKKYRYLLFSIVGVMFLVIFAIFGLTIKRDLSSGNTSYYLVTKNPLSDKNIALNEGAKARLRGGAGCVYEKNGSYYVVLSCYNSLDDAQKVSKKLSGTDIVKFDVRLSKKSEIAKIQMLGIELSDKLYDLSVNFDKGEIDTATVKINLEKIKEQLESEYYEVKKDGGTENLEVIRFVSAVENMLTCNESFLSWNLKNQRVKILEICESLEK